MVLSTVKGALRWTVARCLGWAATCPARALAYPRAAQIRLLTSWSRQLTHSTLCRIRRSSSRRYVCIGSKKCVVRATPASTCIATLKRRFLFAAFSRSAVTAISKIRVYTGTRAKKTTRARPKSKSLVLIMSAAFVS